MNTPLYIRNTFFFLLTLLALIYSLPNFYGESPALEISGPNITKLSLTQALNASNYKFKSIEKKDHSWLVRFIDTEDQLGAQKKLSNEQPNWIIALNLANNTPQWLLNIGATPMKLGLDLRGGVHFLLDVDIKPVIESRIKGDSQEVGVQLRNNKIEIKRIFHNDTSITVSLENSKDLKQAMSLLKSTLREYDIQIQDNQLVLILSANTVQQQTKYTIEQTIQILSNRVNELGVSEAVVQQEGESMVSIDLPGIQDTAKAKDLLGSNAQVSFQLVSSLANDPNDRPFGTKWYTYNNRKILLEETPILTGDSITYAASLVSDQGHAVLIRLSGGASRFYRKTAENVGNQLAVVYQEKSIDDKLSNENNKIWRSKSKVISVATINQALGNSFEINNLESQAYAEKLALLLRSGALTAPYAIIEETLIGPSLGKENIAKGTYSLTMGFMLVVLFMLIYYVEFGIIANIALFLNLVFLVALLSILGSTLTLPGIAGIVLTVGMAVDANVLINERIREELKRGLSLGMSIKAGYEKAFATIVDANVTTLIVAMILFGLGSGSIKGFAITLILGLLSSMLTSIYVARAMTETYRIYRKNMNIGV
ncbi:MAG: protein translocase subunit SecD [Pseudomonadota bacterium]|nr:protein translocase subunit SecD [Pseudomonadota bacterium]